jgi:diadenosine tetraphosphatase ApaH/serine/threonine PP2A family protein phosphatase
MPGSSAAPERLEGTVLHWRPPAGRPLRRVALLGGLYSNYLALGAALDDAHRAGVDAIFCLGDLGAFGPHPDRVFPLLRDHAVATLAGNYDDSIARGLAECQCGYSDPRDNYFARLSYDYTFRHTSPENKAWLASLPAQIRIEIDGARVLLCHGSPRRQNEFLWESTTPDHFLDKLCTDWGADAIAATHTGIKWSRALPNGRLFVNVGVLGRPENDGTARVWYTILERTGLELREDPRSDRPERSRPAGEWKVEFRPVDYDHQHLAAEMQEERLPPEFVETILTGWWTTCLEVLPAKERARGRY